MKKKGLFKLISKFKTTFYMKQRKIDFLIAHAEKKYSSV
jgi:hypothetical protein